MFPLKIRWIFPWQNVSSFTRGYPVIRVDMKGQLFGHAIRMCSSCHRIWFIPWSDRNLWSTPSDPYKTWGPKKDSVQLVDNYKNLGLWFMVVITIVRWGYKPTYNVWGPHIVQYPYIHSAFCKLHAPYGTAWWCTSDKNSKVLGTTDQKYPWTWATSGHSNFGWLWMHCGSANP